MNIFLSADIEGTCGITAWAETEQRAPADYGYFQKQMTREVAAACQGALKAGAKSIFVKDAHDSARNIDPSALPETTRILRGWTGDPLSMMSGLDKGEYGAVFFTGYHAWAACGGNPLSHTMNTNNEYVTINGVRASEFLLNAYTAGYYGVPVSLVTGDKALCASAQALIPNLIAVPVNEGFGGGVVSIHPALAVKQIQEAAAKAVKAAPKCAVPMPPHFDLVVRFREHKTAYSKSFYPGARLEDEKNVCYETNDWYEALRFCHFVLSD